MMIEGDFENVKSTLITIALQKGQKKAVLHDKKAYEDYQNTSVNFLSYYFHQMILM